MRWVWRVREIHGMPYFYHSVWWWCLGGGERGRRGRAGQKVAFRNITELSKMHGIKKIEVKLYKVVFSIKLQAKNPTSFEYEYFLCNSTNNQYFFFYTYSVWCMHLLHGSTYKCPNPLLLFDIYAMVNCDIFFCTYNYLKIVSKMFF